ncbi:MAG: DNA helicase UvrD [Acidobacteria bacterium]|nr:MAG: DNA helicase UvrD [Acidobacteriota bacterium]
MRFIADLHIHSHFSLATSRQLTPEHLDHWGRVKGIKVIGTGDFTHPRWISELEDKLEPAEPGLFRLRPELRLRDLPGVPETEENSVRFLLTGEISNIYKRDGAVRKVHNLVLAPDFETVKRVRAELERLGFNLVSDGRPILGLDSRDLLEVLLSASPRTLLVPAHIWTPWFSVLGAKSGFDSVEECYRDLSYHIAAVETGLSSDPPMNWRCSRLDRFRLISNSDAHSPEKLGREGNVLDAELSYEGILAALRGSETDRLEATIEFFPQEGKYHHDGHRKCQVVWGAEETGRHAGRCTACGKPVTVGVMSRVLKLADRKEGEAGSNRQPFYSVIPLPEILGELLGTGAAAKKVREAYQRIIHKAGSEFDVLLWLPPEDLTRAGGTLFSEAIRRMRARQAIVQPGYDGEYGIIKLFTPEELKSFGYTGALFVLRQPEPNQGPGERLKATVQYPVSECAGNDKHDRAAELAATYVKDADKTPLGRLNPEQRLAAEHPEGAALVIAGPGTGKTRVLTARVAGLITEKKIDPASFLVVTFTNRAAGELRQRLRSLLGDASRLPWIGTFHSFGYSILAENPLPAGRRPGFQLVDEEDRETILGRELGYLRPAVLAAQISRHKATGETPGEEGNPTFSDALKAYDDYLREQNLFDLDDLIAVPVRLLCGRNELLEQYRRRYSWVLIDEYQDVNQAQYDLIRLLAPDSGSNLFAIGDPDQAIYGFRGSDVRFIGRFLRDYPGARHYRLGQSYRCSQMILSASEDILGRPDEGDGLRGTAAGLKVRIVPEGSDKSEAEFVARTIEARLGGVRFFSLDSRVATGDEETPAWGFSDFAILCRLGRQMPVLEKALQDHGIPYQKVEETPFFKRAPVRTILDLLSLWHRPDRDLPRQRLQALGIDVAGSVERLSQALTGGGASVSELISALPATDLGDSFGSGVYASSDIERLRCFAADFGTDLQAFLRHTSLGSAPDGYRPEIENVALMTLHAAKGLEFRCVFIPGCEEGILPCTMFGRTVDCEEERRLLYVGMTRARDSLFLTHAGRRFLAGRMMENVVSRFLAPIDRQLVEIAAQSRNPARRKPDPQLRLF